MRPSRAALLMISPQIPVPIWLKNEASRPMQPSVSTTRSNMFLLFSNDVEGEFSEVPQLTLFPEAYTSSSERSMLQTLRGTKSRRVKAQDRYPPSSKTRGSSPHSSQTSHG